MKDLVTAPEAARRNICPSGSLAAAGKRNCVASSEDLAHTLSLMSEAQTAECHVCPNTGFGADGPAVACSRGDISQPAFYVASWFLGFRRNIDAILSQMLGGFAACRRVISSTASSQPCLYIKASRL